MPTANMSDALQLPALQVPAQQVVECGHAWSSSSTPTLRRRRFKMRRTRNVQQQGLETAPSSNKEFLQLPSIEITPSSDEDTAWSNCSTPSASPRRKRFLLHKWLSIREKKEYSESRYVHPLPFPSLSSSPPTMKKPPKPMAHYVSCLPLLAELAKQECRCDIHLVLLPWSLISDRRNFCML